MLKPYTHQHSLEWTRTQIQADGCHYDWRNAEVCSQFPTGPYQAKSVHAPLCMWSNHTLMMDRTGESLQDPLLQRNREFLLEMPVSRHWNCSQKSEHSHSLHVSRCESWCCLCVQCFSGKAGIQFRYCYWCRHSATIGSWTLSEGFLGSCFRVLPQFS